MSCTISEGEILSINLMLGDCLERMKEIPDGSIDMVLCDLPYGTTACKWDSTLDLPSLWSHYSRITTERSAIVLTGSQPFTSALIQSNLPLFKYCWVWKKSRASNFVHSKHQPLKEHEDIVVFSKSPAAQNSAGRNMSYFPQMVKGKPYNKGVVQNDSMVLSGEYKKYSGVNTTGDRFPRSVLEFSSDSDKAERGLHPTQKPLVLFEYLVKTYSQEYDTVLDNCMGSGTTGVACKSTNRNFIGIEMDEGYFNIAKERINAAQDAKAACKTT